MEKRSRNVLPPVTPHSQIKFLTHLTLHVLMELPELWDTFCIIHDFLWKQVLWHISKMYINSLYIDKCNLLVNETETNVVVRCHLNNFLWHNYYLWWCTYHLLLLASVPSVPVKCAKSYSLMFMSLMILIYYCQNCTVNIRQLKL